MGDVQHLPSSPPSDVTGNWSIVPLPMHSVCWLTTTILSYCTDSYKGTILDLTKGGSFCLFYSCATHPA